MADLDPLGLYPNSKMAQAVRLGQSRFYSAEAVAPAGATFNGSNLLATITNNGLTATHDNTAAIGGAQSASVKSTGKYYFEITVGTLTTSCCVGLMTPTSTYSTFVINGTNCVAVYMTTGQIWSNNANSTKLLGALVNGDIVGIAMDFDNDKIWVRKTPSGNWNGDVAANPATNTNGVSTSSFAATTLTPAVAWGNTAGGVFTMNTGGSAFTSTVPSGFTAGWPV